MHEEHVPLPLREESDDTATEQLNTEVIEATLGVDPATPPGFASPPVTPIHVEYEGTFPAAWTECMGFLTNGAALPLPERGALLMPYGNYPAVHVQGGYRGPMVMVEIPAGQLGLKAFACMWYGVELSRWVCAGRTYAEGTISWAHGMQMLREALDSAHPNLPHPPDQRTPNPPSPMHDAAAMHPMPSPLPPIVVNLANVALAPSEPSGPDSALGSVDVSMAGSPPLDLDLTLNYIHKQKLAAAKARESYVGRVDDFRAAIVADIHHNFNNLMGELERMAALLCQELRRKLVAAERVATAIAAHQAVSMPISTYEARPSTGEGASTSANTHASAGYTSPPAAPGRPGAACLIQPRRGARWVRFTGGAPRGRLISSPSLRPKGRQESFISYLQDNRLHPTTSPLNRIDVATELLAKTSGRPSCPATSIQLNIFVEVNVQGEVRCSIKVGCSNFDDRVAGVGRECSMPGLTLTCANRVAEGDGVNMTHVHDRGVLHVDLKKDNKKSGVI